MIRFGRISIAGLILLPALLMAAEKPDMTRQKTWGEQEKDAFYEWLQEQRAGAPGAEENQPVRTSQTLEQLQEIPSTLSNKYFNARLAFYDMRDFALGFSPEGGGDEAAGKQIAVTQQDLSGSALSGDLDADLMGLELQYGKPLKTWFRRLLVAGYYRGSAHWATEQGLKADFSLLRAGYHLELALVPLGLDQTRNIVLRGGLDLFWGRPGELTAADEGDLEGQRRRTLEETMLDQVTGWQGGFSWSVGYERQLGENFWRVHGMVDGFKAFHLPRDDDRQDWSTLGMAAGISRVF
jgi:hypothetical protein